MFQCTYNNLGLGFRTSHVHAGSILEIPETEAKRRNQEGLSPASWGFDDRSGGFTGPDICERFTV
jgi:hypothetical protein